jgi:hypothetical protein
MRLTLFCEFFVVLVVKYFLLCIVYEMLLVDCYREKIGSADLDRFTCFRGRDEQKKMRLQTYFSAF